MRFSIWIICSIFVLALFSYANANDSITVTLSQEDKNITTTLTPLESIKGRGIHKVFAYIKIASNTASVVPKTYYLEWRRNKENHEEVLSNYNTDKKWLVYRRRANIVDDYYRVNKLVFGSKTGEYIFMVYEKDTEGKYILLVESKFIVEE